MKKALLLITVITALSSAVFAGCGTKDPATDNGADDVITEKRENPDSQNNGSGFEYIPRELNGRAVNSDEENPENGEKPEPEKHRKPKPRHGLPDGEIFIIRFGRGYRDHDRFKPVPPVDPDDPVEPDDPEQPVEETEPNG